MQTADQVQQLREDLKARGLSKAANVEQMQGGPGGRGILIIRNARE